MEMERELAEPRPQPREKQQISVPYHWEEKPGIRKQGWSCPAIPVNPLPSPVRQIVSVPFEWEEKPGKPIQLTERVPDLLTPSSFPWVDALDASSFYLNPFVDEEVHHLNSFKTNDNIFLPTTDQSFTVSAAQESFTEDGSYWNENWHSASETQSHRSSSSSGEENVGADTAVVRFLFPVSPSDTRTTNNNRETNKEPHGKEACADLLLTDNNIRKHTPLAKRTLTLGELILLSRQLSCRTKRVDINRRNNPKESLTEGLLTCFPFITKGNKIGAYISS
ncbi:hypothetical protein Cni_G07730 [Canna indica]|uniref:Uncharacterized protein n=1 Tax=Canna indica TaxID=4628 RepID=A0AAQ3JZ90_9LILI|nr:hypothetical protein Cni_G07730 [Canna indica]